MQSIIRSEDRRRANARNVSLVICPSKHLTLKKSTSYEEINKVVKKASVSDPRGFLRYTEDHGWNSVNSTLSSWFLGMTMSMATATVL